MMHHFGGFFDGFMGWPWYGSIFIWIGIGIYVTISVLMTYFVHKDALNRNISNPETWIIIILIFNIVGLLIYLLVRDNYKHYDRN